MTQSNTRLDQSYRIAALLEERAKQEVEIGKVFSERSLLRAAREGRAQLLLELADQIRKEFP